MKGFPLSSSHTSGHNSQLFRVSKLRIITSTRIDRIPRCPAVRRHTHKRRLDGVAISVDGPETAFPESLYIQRTMEPLDNSIDIRYSKRTHWSVKLRPDRRPDLVPQNCPRRWHRPLDHHGARPGGPDGPSC